MPRKSKLLISATTFFVLLIVALVATACGKSSSAEAQPTLPVLTPVCDHPNQGHAITENRATWVSAR